jgi:hypothetical protein
MKIFHSRKKTVNNIKNTLNEEEDKKITFLHKPKRYFKSMHFLNKIRIDSLEFESKIMFIKNQSIFFGLFYKHLFCRMKFFFLFNH